MSNDRTAIGIDIGGTSIKFALVRQNGQILRHGQLPTPLTGPDAIISAVAEGVRHLTTGSDEQPVGIGLGVPGIVDARGHVAHPPNLPGWDIVDVGARLRPRLMGIDLPITVENDANVAALAEAQVGAGMGERNFLYVTLGTGVGGCIISDGSIWRGTCGGAGEIGHISVDINGPLCNCGSRGCIEAYVGNRYMSALAAARLEREPDSMLHAWIAAGQGVDPQRLDEAAMSGDRFSAEFLAEMGELLGAALASAMNLLDMSLVVVGGGLSRSDASLLEPARRSMRRRLLKTLSPVAEVRPARYLNDAGVVGGALMAMNIGA